MKPFQKLKKLKVLIGCPHAEIKNYALDKYLSIVTNLSYPKRLYDVMIVDNSITKDNAVKIRKAGLHCLHVKPKQKSNQQYITESQELLRLEAIRGGYDYLIFIESDIEPPVDIIEKLLVHQKQIVSGSYFIQHGHESHLMIQDIEEDGTIVKHTVNVDNGFDILRMDGKLKKVYACGFGVLAIHKSIFEKVPFRWVDGADVHSDTIFAMDIDAMGVGMYLDTSLLVHHNNSSWSEITDYMVLPKK